MANVSINIDSIGGHTHTMVPEVGDLVYQSGQILTYVDGDWKIVDAGLPLWMDMWIVFHVKADNIGIWAGVLDSNNLPKTWTAIGDGEPDYYEISPKWLSKIDYETQLAFDALPVMEVERESPAGILLKFPD